MILKDKFAFNVDGDNMLFSVFTSVVEEQAVFKNWIDREGAPIPLTSPEGVQLGEGYFVYEAKVPVPVVKETTASLSTCNAVELLCGMVNELGRYVEGLKEQISDLEGMEEENRTLRDLLEEAQGTLEELVKEVEEVGDDPSETIKDIVKDGLKEALRDAIDELDFESVGFGEVNTYDAKQLIRNIGRTV